MAEIAVYIYHQCADCPGPWKDPRLYNQQRFYSDQTLSLDTKSWFWAHIASLPPSLCEPWSFVEQYLWLGEQQHHISWPGPHFLLPQFCVILELYRRRDLMLVLPLLPVIPFLQTVLLGRCSPQRPCPSSVLQTKTCWASYNWPQGGILPTSYLCKCSQTPFWEELWARFPSRQGVCQWKQPVLAWLHALLKDNSQSWLHYNVQSDNKIWRNEYPHWRVASRTASH